MPYYLDNTFLLDNPWITVVGCGGTGGFVAEASAASSRAATPPSSWWTTTEWSPTTCCDRISTLPTWGRFKSQALADRLAKAYTTGPSATRSIPSGRRTAATPAFPPTTACSSAAPTTPPQGGPWPSACPETPAAGSRRRQRY